MNAWQLPQRAVLQGKTYGFRGDFRVILQIMGYLSCEDYPECLRWYIALALFYTEPIPEAAEADAMAYLADFIRCGRPDTPGPQLISWEQDAQLIAGELNRVAGFDLRAQPFVHWWTFLSLFHSIGPGRLCTVVAIRDKRRKGRPLEGWEQEFYAQNRALVDISRPLSPEEEKEKQRLEALLKGGEHGK